jgi:hypothetical protein
MRSPKRSGLLLVAAGLISVAAVLPRAEAGPAAPPVPGPDAGAAVSGAGLDGGVTDGGASDGGPRGRALPPPGDVANTCATCHAGRAEAKLRQPSDEYAKSVHRDERIGCVGCHKGDARDPTAGAHKAEGFVSHPQHAEVADICGGCHSDAAFMRRINARLPGGQLALYKLSLHGKLAASGDAAAPTCSVCHGKHDVLPVASPKSPVNRANVAELCSGCHGDPKRMATYGIKTDQFAKWQKSVHGEAFRKGNQNAPTCTGCHGAHSATPPEAASVARACGRCHDEELGLFEQSPHSKGFRKRGLAPCVACHSNHDVAPASSLLVGVTPDATCTKCHATDEKPMKVADKLAGLLRHARDRAAQARATLARARTDGYHIAGAAYALDQVGTAELRLRPVVHTLDPDRMETAVAAVEKAVVAAEQLDVDARLARRIERRGYYAALALAVVLFTALLLKTMELDRRRRRGAP